MRSSARVERHIASSLILGAVLVAACGVESGDDDAGAGTSGSAGATTAGAGGSTASGGNASGAGGAAGSPVTSGASGSGGNESGGTSAAGTSARGGTSAGSGSGGDGNPAGDGGSAGALAGSAGTSGGVAGGSGGTGGDDAARSPGCGVVDVPASGPYTLTVGSDDRDYIVKVPENYDPNRPYRLIFAFHGRMYDAESVDSGGPPGSGPYYGIEAEANGSAIFVAPQALSSSWTNEGNRDVDYVEAMRERLTGEFCIDESRVFAAGFSMGAIMTITLGCVAPSTFRAIAPMSGSLPSSTMLPGGCSGNPIPYWSSHGLQDMTIRPPQGEAARDAFVAMNGCDDTTIPAQPEGCVAYEGCDPGYPVSWCTFEGEHEPAPFAGTAIWNFLAQF